MKKHLYILFITNFFGVLNDNFLKTLACFIAIKWVDPSSVSNIVSVAAGCLVLPYIFLSPIASNLAVKYSKKKIVLYCKIAEIPIILLAILGFYTQQLWLIIFSIFLMGTQSSLYSPAKYGLIRDVGGEKNLAFGVGTFESTSFIGMLSGTLAASFLVDLLPMNMLYILLIGFAISGLLFSIFINPFKNYSQEQELQSVDPIKFLIKSHHIAKDERGLNSIIIGLSVFWWLAASMQMGLLVFCPLTMGLTSWQTGIVLSMAAIGIAVGCYLAGIYQNKIYIFKGAVTTGIGVSLIMLFIFIANPGAIVFSISIFASSVLCGFFKVPLDTAIQKRTSHSNIVIILAYFNQVSFIFILLASLTYGITAYFLPPRYLFLMLSVLFFCGMTYTIFGVNSMLKKALRNLLRIRYRVSIKGKEKIDATKTHLFLPNHQAVIDPIILFCELYDIEISPLVDESYFNIPIAKYILNRIKAVSVPDLSLNRKNVNKVRDLLPISLKSLNSGKNIIIYPSGKITLDGTEKIGNKSLAYNICSNISENTDVYGIKIKGLWGSSFSKYGRTSTPPILEKILRGIYTFKFIGLRHKVSIEIFPLTKEIQTWSSLEKVEFNKKLEEFYNQ